MQTEPELFSYEWFCSLTDKELSDIGWSEAMIVKGDTYWLNSRQRVSDLLAALSKRLEEKS